MTTATAPAPAPKLGRNIGWGRVGTRIGADEQSIEQVLTKSDLNWNVSKRALATTPVPGITWTSDGTQVNPDPMSPNPGEVLPLTEHFCTVRNDANIVFGPVGSVYTVLQNDECISIVDTLLNQDDIQIIRAGSFCKGANVWVLCEYNKPIRLGAEKLRQFIKIGWSHDGTEQLHAQFLIRLENGVMIQPDLPNARSEVKIRHTTNAKERIKMAKKIIDWRGKYEEKFKETAKRMVKMNCSDVLKYLKMLFPKYDAAKIDQHGFPVDSKDKKMADEIKATFDETGQTFWDAFKVVGEYADSKSTRVKGVGAMSEDEAAAAREEARVKSKLSGSAAAMKKKAWRVLSTPVLKGA